MANLGYDDTPLLPGGKWHVHDGNRPQPPVVTPGCCCKPPSDAIVLFDGTNTVELDARPSDSIALAVRADCPIFVDDEVMAVASREMPPDDDFDTDQDADREVELEEFREFLAHVDPEDFAGTS